MFNNFKTLLSLVVIVLIGSIVLLGMSKRADNHNANSTEGLKADTIVIDFHVCLPTKARVWVALGSTTYQILGKTNDVCTMKYGNEIENPNWDGVLNHECNVPISSGKMDFKKNTHGLDFSSIQKYCTG